MSVQLADGVHRFEPYPAYKESGVEWLGEIPEQWDAFRLGSIGGFSKGNGGSKVDEVDEGVPCIRYGDLYTQHKFFIRSCRSFVTEERSADYTKILHGDVLFAGSGETLEEIGKSAVNLLDSNACCGGDVLLFRPTREVIASFMGYASDCPQSVLQKARMGRGVTVMHIYADRLKTLTVALPPLDEQRLIAAFLDRETGKIDALVVKLEQLVELLQEKRTALISHAVTKGLDPNVPMKDSGVEWLGQIPAHWKVKPLGRAVSISGGSTPSKDNLAYWDGNVPWVSPKDMKRWVLDDSEDHITELALRQSGISLIQPSAVLIVIRGMILARDFPVAVNAVAVTINQDMKALRPSSSLSGSYLAHELRVIQEAFFAIREESGHGTKCLRTELWKGIVVAVPPFEEQEDICREVDNKTRTLDSLTAKVRDGIDRLREYRAALISAAVTGKIDVRGEAAC